VERFQGGLVFKAYRLLCHSTLGLRVIETKKKKDLAAAGLAGLGGGLPRHLLHKTKP